MSERKTAEQLYTGTHALSDAQVGDKLGSLDFVISAEQVERNAWANDDYNTWYIGASPCGGGRFFVQRMWVTDPDGTEVMRMSKTVAPPVRPASEPSGTPNAAPTPGQ